MEVTWQQHGKENWSAGGSKIEKAKNRKGFLFPGGSSSVIHLTSNHIFNRQVMEIIESFLFSSLSLNSFRIFHLSIPLLSLPCHAFPYPFLSLMLIYKNMNASSFPVPFTIIIHSDTNEGVGKPFTYLHLHPFLCHRWHRREKWGEDNNENR